MVTVKEPLSDFTDLGPVIYQESKILDNEIHLLCVHDNREKKFVNFEAYSFETGKITRIQWDYMNFDSHFRFNAELMNPNNREGRYHWICERLAFVSDGKGGRKLGLGEPTDDVPQSADKARNFKIPTGRMNYADRQRLRQEMTRLPSTRAQSIQQLELAFKARFLAEVEESKALEKKRKALRLERIAQERSKRYDDLERKRDGRLKEKSDARARQELAVIKEILARHKQEAAIKKQHLDGLRDAKLAAKLAQKTELERKIAADIHAEQRRLENWAARDGRVEQKAIRLQAARASFLEAEERKDAARSERQKELAHEMNMIRANLWAIHHEKQAKRLKDQESTIKAVAQAKEEARAASALALQKHKRKISKDKDAGGKDGKKDVEGADKMDAVERSMRAQMEKEGQERKMALKRQERQGEKDKKKAIREYTKVMRWKEMKENMENDRTEMLATKQKAREEAARAARMEAMRARDMKKRRTGARETAIQRKTDQRMRKLCPRFKPKPNEFLPS